jgi:methionyl-tRNA formyltransferase
MTKTNIVFFGSGPYGNIALKRLLDRGLVVDIVVTKNDAPSGRGQILKENVVATTAKSSNIKTLKPDKLDALFIGELLKEKPDLFLIVSYGKILPKEVLSIPSFGTINIHPSLLPKYRGTAPLEYPFLNNDSVTGVTLMILDEEMDHGPILIQDEFEIHPDMRKIDLGGILFEHGADLLVDNLEQILNQEIKPTEQDHNVATYTKKIKKEDGELDLSKDDECWRKYRAYLGYPGVYFFNESAKRFKVTDAEFVDGKFIIKKVIPEGGKEIEYKK